MDNKTIQVTPDLLASHWQRIANYVLDGVFVVIGMFVAMIVASMISTLAGSMAVMEYLAAMNDTKLYCITAASIVAYYGLTETYYSKSLAKFITKTIVVMADGSKPSHSVILIRSFCRLIPLEFISFLFSFPPRGWHDLFSQTYVVDKARFDARIKSPANQSNLEP